MKRNLFSRCAAGLLILTGLTAGQIRFNNAGIGGNTTGTDVKVTARFSSDTLAEGGTTELLVTLTIDGHLHINSSRPLEDFLIPTRVSVAVPAGVTAAEPRYPEALLKKFSFSENDMSVYEGTVTIPVVLSAQGAVSGTHTLTVKVRYQACSEKSCFAPQNTELPLALAITGGTGTAAAEKSTDGLSQAEREADSILQKGFLYALLAFFIAGLALNLTPCVYPVIPITVGYFTQQGGKSKSGNLVIGLFYVLGIALVFAALGLISSAAGKQWGFLFQNPWFVMIIALIMLSMSASMFGAFEITAPQWLMRSGSQSRSGGIGAFIMGLTVGAIIAPCASGIIVGLVGIVARAGTIVTGTLLFFVMGLGLGVPYLILAVFSGSLATLPRSGMWMIWIKKFFGFVLIGIAVYFLLPQIKHAADLQYFLLGFVIIFGGLFLGFLDHAPGYSKVFQVGRKVFGLVLIVTGILLADRGLSAPETGIAWTHAGRQTPQDLLAMPVPIFLDFRADWCAPCKKMERQTFTDDRVIEAAANWTFIKVDCTTPDASIKRLMDHFGVVGMPTMIFIDPDGNEVAPLRTTGYLEADELVQMMENVAPAE